MKQVFIIHFEIFGTVIIDFLKQKSHRNLIDVDRRLKNRFAVAVLNFGQDIQFDQFLKNIVGQTNRDSVLGCDFGSRICFFSLFKAFKNQTGNN